MPMIPELVYTMLACARIGAVHSIVVSCIFEPPQLLLHGFGRFTWVLCSFYNLFYPWKNLAVPLFSTCSYCISCSWPVKIDWDCTCTEEGLSFFPGSFSSCQGFKYGSDYNCPHAIWDGIIVSMIPVSQILFLSLNLLYPCGEVLWLPRSSGNFQG